MNDAGVETVLREIRERVRGEVAARSSRGGDNFTGPANGIPASDALVRLRANLNTTERAWGQLPPVVSFNRQGWKARLEVWIKRQVRRATHWYVYEQINFNAAVNGALHNVASALEQSLTEQRVCVKQLSIELSEQAVVFDRARRAMQSGIDELSSRLESLDALQAEVEQLRRSLESAGRTALPETSI